MEVGTASDEVRLQRPVSANDAPTTESGLQPSVDLFEMSVLRSRTRTLYTGRAGRQLLRQKSALAKSAAAFPPLTPADFERIDPSYARDSSAGATLRTQSAKANGGMECVNEVSKTMEQT
jgi:hypothetical protein